VAGPTVEAAADAAAIAEGGGAARAAVEAAADAAAIAEGGGAARAAVDAAADDAAIAEGGGAARAAVDAAASAIAGAAEALAGGAVPVLLLATLGVMPNTQAITSNHPVANPIRTGHHPRACCMLMGNPGSL
jgi:hypothetical protein